MTVFNYIAQYMFLLTPLVTHLLHDVPEINGGRRINHKRNVYFLAAATIVLSLAVQQWSSPHVNFLQFMFYSATIHFAFFNYILNRRRIPPEPIHYLAGGFYDSILRMLTPLPALLVQLILLFAGFSLYHFPKWYHL